MRRLSRWGAVKSWLRYWLIDDVHPGYEPGRFATRWTVFVLLAIAVIVLLGVGMIALTGCDPECTVAYPNVGNYRGQPGHYTFRATHRLSNGALVELHQPWLIEELDEAVTRALELARAIGPTLTDEELDDEHGFCVAHLARNPRCDVSACLRIRILPLRMVHVSQLDGVTLLLNDSVDRTQNYGCWVRKPWLDPSLPIYWPAGCQEDSVCVAPVPSGEYFTDAEWRPIEGAYGRWSALQRAVIDWYLGCYNSPLISQVAEFLAAEAAR
jgi:hypothetical protein